MLFGHLDSLSHRNQARLREELERATRALGSPVAIELVPHLPGSRAGQDRVARDAFDAHGFDIGRSDPVLLVVSLDDRRAAIETGKGAAGIVPEIDARAITTELARNLSPANLPEHLWRALDAIVASARATRERRQPLVQDDEPARAPVSGTATDGEAVAPAGALPGEEPPAPAARTRSRLPIAAAVGVLVLLALALQRRRHFAATRAAAEEQAARERAALARRAEQRPGAGPPTRPNPRG
jgi:uncharacterized membrane protein YgcG